MRLTFPGPVDCVVPVPAYGVGRTQELLYALNELKRRGRLPAFRVFVSPLAINITEVFKLHPVCFDIETRALLQERDVFGFEGMEFASSREEFLVHREPQSEESEPAALQEHAFDVRIPRRGEIVELA